MSHLMPVISFFICFKVKDYVSDLKITAKPKLPSKPGANVLRP